MVKIKIRTKIPKDINFLLVEPDKITRKNEIEILKQMGFRGKIFESSSLQSANVFLDENEVHFIIIDSKPTDGSGLDFVKALRSKDKYKNIPIMMVAKEKDLEIMFEALKGGVTNYVVKPFAVEVFIDRLQMTYSRHTNGGR